MSTRGRANGLRAALEGRLGSKNELLRGSEIEALLSSCLACKACVTECPSNVNLALLKAEVQYARIQDHGLNRRQRLFGSIDAIGKLGCLLPRLSNRLMGFLVLRTVFAKAFGLAWQRPIPPFAKERFDRWFAKHSPNRLAPRGRIVLWDDTFARYYEPQIAIAAVKVLEAAGYRVELAHGRKCCGRPAFSQGDLDKARQLGEHNVKLLRRDADDAPILFLEPSCYSMFVEDYLELKIPEAAAVAHRCFLFDHFVADLLQHEPEALCFFAAPGKVIVHAHCHLKSLMKHDFLQHLAERIPGAEVTLLDSGCCGMAGGFGAMEAHYELSLKVAAPLASLVRNQPYGTTVIASGTSCRQQIGHLAPVRPRHMAEFLAANLQQFS